MDNYLGNPGWLLFLSSGFMLVYIFVIILIILKKLETIIVNNPV